MKPRRTNPSEYLPTAADYLAKAVCPFLIMTLVGSLAFFIEAVVYQGSHELRLKWLIFWCVLGMVGISRIAIEKTPAYAGIYALALGLAGYTFVSRFFEMPWAGWFVLGGVWWCTNKLVWDCTLIDEKADASGEGLLGVAGMDETGDDDGGQSAAVTVASTKKLSLWKRMFTNAREASARPHAPGLWVLYFSIAALPIFGFGQLILTRLDQRAAGLVLAVVYLVSTISLLLLTSFLGLRRYLRQRRLKMPGSMAARWITTGALITAAILVIGLLMPRPLVSSANGSPTGWLPGKALANDHYADGGEETEEANKPPENDKADSDGEEQSDDADQAKQGSGKDDQSGEKRSEEADTEQDSSGTTPSIPNPLSIAWLRWIVWTIFGLITLVYAWKHRQEIAEATRQLWASLLALFGGGRKQISKKRSSRTAQTETQGTVPPRTFAELVNPFSSAEKSLSADVVVERTYDALEVWAAENGRPRDREMTANEFARDMAYLHPDAKREINRLISLHSGWIYADRAPTAEELPPLARLWEYMRTRSQAASV